MIQIDMYALIHVFLHSAEFLQVEDDTSAYFAVDPDGKKNEKHGKGQRNEEVFSARARAVQKRLANQIEQMRDRVDIEPRIQNLIGLKLFFLKKHRREVPELDDDTYQVQVVSWYDNENSYTSQMVRTIKYFAELG